jgi:hypothetical protein
MTQNEGSSLTWREAVLQALRRYSSAHETSLIYRSELISEELERIVDAAGSDGVTPEQTLSRVLQELRSDELLEFLGNGLYDVTSILSSNEGDTVGLKLFGTYSRPEVHVLLDPLASFVSQRGQWGLQGIIPITDRPSDFVFFVTLGQAQGDHVFDEGITEDGVLSWQSQPRQSFRSPQIQRLINHDEFLNRIYFFLRTNRRQDYSYLGRLKYLAHDSARENPVYFQWQLLDWPMPERVLRDMGLELASPEVNTGESTGVEPTSSGLVEIDRPNSRGRHGIPTRTFRGRKAPDRSEIDASNRRLGRAGELLVCETERLELIASGFPELAQKVNHVAETEGDGAGYDVLSFYESGERKYIEVKTTRGPSETPFFITRNEVEFATSHPNNYELYRLCDFRSEPTSAHFYRLAGPLKEKLNLDPTVFRAEIA